jgi:MFS family permease
MKVIEVFVERSGAQLAYFLFGLPPLSWQVAPEPTEVVELIQIEKVWPADQWPIWVPAFACAICALILTCMPLYIAAQVDAAWSFDLSAENKAKLWWARFITDLSEFVQYLRASVLVATSITIAAHSGRGVGDSGLLISAFWCSYWIGAISFKFRSESIAVRKTDFLIATILMSFSTVLAAIVGVQQPPYTMLMMCVLQAISGASGSYAGVFRDIVRKYVYDPKDVNRAVTRKKFCQAIGMTCGPLLSAAAGVVVVHPDHGHVAGIFVLGPVYVAFVAAVFIYYPDDLRPLVPGINASEEQASIERGSSRERDFMLIAVLASWAPVTICLSCVENATVAILSTEFNYTFIQAGIFVSMSFLSYPFIDYTYDKMRKSYHEKTILRFSLFTAAAASFFISGHLCAMTNSVSGCLWLILLADMVMYPLLHLSLGILQGWALRYAANEGILSASNMTILRMAIHSVARGFTPWLARVMLEMGGRDYYAAAQATLLLASLVTAETRVVPFVQAMEDGMLTSPRKKE